MLFRRRLERRSPSTDIPEDAPTDFLVTVATTRDSAVWWGDRRPNLAPFNGARRPDGVGGGWADRRRPDYGPSGSSRPIGTSRRVITPARRAVPPQGEAQAAEHRSTAITRRNYPGRLTRIEGRHDVRLTEVVALE